MSEQLTLITSILTAIFTGGIIIIFIETLHISEHIIERFHVVMKPFYHSFTNYAIFVSYYKSAYTFPQKDASENITLVNKNINTITNLAFPSIISGQDYSDMHFSYA